jgi:MFS family permease
VIRSLTVEIQKLDVAGWVVTGYFVSYAISMTFMGRVSDLSGRRLVYLSCLVIFFVGSWLVAASPGWPAAIASRIMKGFQTDVPDPAFAPLYALIFGRVVQAFGAGAMVPVSMALVADLFPPEKRALPLGIVGAIDTGGWVLGHLYGGIMVQFMTWPYLFWINLPIIAVMFVATWFGLAGLPRTETEGRIDWIGVALLAVALVLLNVGLGSPEVTSEVTTAPPRHQMYWVAGAAVTFVIFLFSQKRLRDPILNLGIFSNRNVAAANGVNLLVGFCIMIALVSVPIFINVAGSAQDTRRAALVTGYLLCAFTVPMALAAVPGRLLTTAIAGLSCRTGRRRRISDDEFLESRDGRTGRRVLRKSPPGGHCRRRARHRIHGGRTRSRGNWRRTDHRADRDGGDQRRPRSGARHGLVPGDHSPAHWHERQYEFDDCIRAAADDRAWPATAAARRRS